MILPRSSYPLQGVYYFLTNWSLVRRIICVLFLTLVVALLAFGLSFAFLLRLQAIGLSDVGVPAWLSWILSVILCIIESAVFTLVFYLIATPIWQDALFDQVLRLKGLSRVLDERERNVSDLTLCCRGFSAGLTLVVFQIYTLIIVETFMIILTLPLHLIPVLGTFLYCYVNGWVLAWGHQLHYHLEIKQWTLSQSRKFAWQQRDDFLMFGTVAVALEMIPIANFLFVWTNVVGAALWTADVIIDEQKRSGTSDADSRRGLNSSSGVGSGYVAYTASPIASPKSSGVVSYQAITSNQ
ncbi:1361_t:CDS:2 [Ambispora gerdemannii]|uniref:1361_t:CDS:1 n=1 Tax=Ambispora gerdemannii TaxID=144530 RepID=A0A9N9CXA9_9GLOM|nr:1361_t:CDS:2 [Ambispora gerdemannii]